MWPGMDKERFAKQIQSLRKAAQLTQHELAEKAGVSHRVIQDIEHGRGNPTIQTLEALAAALDVSVFSLFGAPIPASAVTPGRHIMKQKQPPDLTAAARFLALYTTMPRERQEAVSALVYDDEAYLSNHPALA